MKIDQITANLPALSVHDVPELKVPPYGYPVSQPSKNSHLALVVESMRYHMTDEGWQIMQALGANDYTLVGHNVPNADYTNIPFILDHYNPAVVVIQDKREWDVRPGDFREPKAKFHNVGDLKEHSNIFKLTILKDAQQRWFYHMESADEIDCHAWLIYYHPKIVKHLAPYVRERHLIRTYHSIDALRVPTYSSKSRDGALLSGALSDAYPWRQQLVRSLNQLSRVTYLPHPGYHRRGTESSQFLETLALFKVAICTSSRYGYALRKIIEATAAGCIVVTNLPEDEVLPGINGNLIRVDPQISIQQLNDLLSILYTEYDPEEQEYFSVMARETYDYRVLGTKLAKDIENLRGNYG